VHLLEVVLPLENFSAMGSGPQLAVMGAALSRHLSEDALVPTVMVPSEPRLRVTLLHAIPQRLRWPLQNPPLLGRPEFRSVTDGFRRDSEDDDLSDGRLWSVTLEGNQFTLEGPAVVASEIARRFAGGVGAAQADQQYMAKAIAWLPLFEEYAEIPNATREAGEYRAALRTALKATRDQDLQALVMAMQDGGHFHVQGQMRDVVVGLIGKGRALTLSPQAQASLGLR
jgi:hypothetical protein